MIPAHEQPERSSIGLAKIWGDGEVGHRVSLLSFVRHILRRAYHNLKRSPVTVALTVITISVALFLLSFFALILHNCALAVSKGGGELVVMVFLKDTAVEADIKKLSAQMTELMPGGKVTYTDKAKALASFRTMLGDDAGMLEGLENENPLPASLDIRAASPEQAERLYLEISERFKGNPTVEGVRYSRGGVQQLKNILALIKGGGIVGIVFLLVITGFIIANTIKLALYGHRMEIEIMQLVGSRRGSIYAPYMIEGLVQGVLGAVIAATGCFLVFVLLRNALLRTEMLQALFPEFQFLQLAYLGWILLAGAVVGMTGSFLAVRRFLAES